MSSQESSKTAILAAFFANMGIAIAKFFAFLLTGSASMIAEAIHSTADTGNQALLLLGGKRSRKAPSAQHQFGYGAERYFWSFVVALILFSLGGLFSLFEGIEKLRHPHKLEDPTIAFVVLGIAIILETFSLRTAVRESRRYKSDASWRDFIRHSKNPELPVVLLEDIGALVGLVLASIGIGLTVITGEERFDAMGSIAIGSLLVVIAAVLASEMKSLLLGESASIENDALIRAALLANGDVRHLIHLRTLHLGPDTLLVTAKLELNVPDVVGVANAINAAEDRIRAAVSIQCEIYLEPDLARTS